METKHYDQPVIYQQITDRSFKDILKESGIKYKELPIEETVLMYEKDGTIKYAYIVQGNVPDTYVENIYITGTIPADMNWKNVALDIDRQKNGESPMQLKTKARFICEKAEEIATEVVGFERRLNPKKFRLALISLGYTLKEIKEMEHRDISEKFLAEMSK